MDYTAGDWPAAVRELTGGRGVDVVVDSVGSTWADSVACLRPGGRVVVFGGTGGGKVELAVRPVTMGQVSILGTTMGSPRDFAGLLAAAEHASWAPVIDSVRPLAEAADAHAREEAGDHFGKLVLSDRIAPARPCSPRRAREIARRAAAGRDDPSLELEALVAGARGRPGRPRGPGRGRAGAAAGGSGRGRPADGRAGPARAPGRRGPPRRPAT